MSRKRIVIGQSEWTLNGEDAAGVLTEIESAIKDGSLLRLSLTDNADRPVEVFINGRTVQSIAVDLGEGPRPSEIS